MAALLGQMSFCASGSRFTSWIDASFEDSKWVSFYLIDLDEFHCIGNSNCDVPVSFSLELEEPLFAQILVKKYFFSKSWLLLVKSLYLKTFHKNGFIGLRSSLHASVKPQRVLGIMLLRFYLLCSFRRLVKTILCLINAVQKI